MTTGLSVLAVDDESPALDELAYLLKNSAMVSHLRAVSSATDALHHLHHERYDVVLLDIAMPGMDGLELARVVAQFSHPPAIVFVTAHDEHALAAFDVGGTDYLLKPVTQERLVTALRRVAQPRREDQPDEDARSTPFRSRSAPHEDGLPRRGVVGGVVGRLRPPAPARRVTASRAAPHVASRGALARARVRPDPPQLPRLAARDHARSGRRRATRSSASARTTSR